ncbi:MAG: tyrosine--tRNA ligase [Candidatus Omnitrophica bacterium 4484_70.1]|nr:MAG: tyrosine--tRNA ligase [Candidatus Omnitrophica bacterium 4484_70.1]
MNKLKLQLEIIRENSVDLISEEELIEKLKISLKKKIPLKIKVGFDPTAKDLHLGHTVLLRKLRKLQELGHWVYFIVGDFTARIGDPSGLTERKPLSLKEIKNNAQTYTHQAFRILDRKKTKIIFNSCWYNDLKLTDFLPLLSHYTVARMMERDDFSYRLKEGFPLSILEFIYPLIQGYDSVKIKADIEVGGTDQKFNLIVGRHLQEAFGQKPQVVVTLPLLVGLDGKNKMSKSLGNYIGITEPPKDMFGKIMSIPDEIMDDYFRLLTEVESEEVEGLHPKDKKMLLAFSIVSQYYSEKVAQKEKEEFERVFSKKEIPLEVPTYYVEEEKIDLVELLPKIGVVSAKNEVRRLISQKGIKRVLKKTAITVEERWIKIDKEVTLKVGKKKFLKLVKKDEGKAAIL